MSGVLRKWGITIAVMASLFEAVPALAFDPFTVAAVVSSAASAIGSASDAASEVGATADAFQELYSETHSESEISDGGQRLVKQIQDLEILASEAGYTGEELSALGRTDPEEAKRLSQVLKKVTRAIKAGKRVSNLLAKLDTKSKIAAIENASVEREHLAATYRLVELHQEAKLSPLKTELEEIQKKRKQIKALKGSLSDQGVKQFKGSGVLAFPDASVVVETSIEVGKKMRPYLMGLILFVFIGRVIFYQIGFFGAERYGALIRDTLLCLVFLTVYPELIRATLYFCNGLSQSFGSTQTQSIRPEEVVIPSGLAFGTYAKTVILWLIEWAKYLGFSLIDFGVTFGLAFLIMLLPLVILLTQIPIFSGALSTFFTGFIILALWPFFWNLIGYGSSLLWDKKVSIGDEFTSMLFSLLQFGSPVLGMKVLSGQSLGGAMSGVIGQSARATKTVLSAGAHQASGIKQGTLGGHGGGSVGRAGGWLLNQAASRGKNAAIGMTHPVKSNYSELGHNPSRASDRIASGLYGAAMNQPPTRWMPNGVSKRKLLSDASKTFGQGLRSQPLTKPKMNISQDAARSYESRERGVR